MANTETAAALAEIHEMLFRAPYGPRWFDMAPDCDFHYLIADRAYSDAVEHVANDLPSFDVYVRNLDGAWEYWGEVDAYSHQDAIDMVDDEEGCGAEDIKVELVEE